MGLDEPFIVMTRAGFEVRRAAGGDEYIRVDEHGVTRYMGLRVVIVEPAAPAEADPTLANWLDAGGGRPIHCLDELFPEPAEKNSTKSMMRIAGQDYEVTETVIDMPAGEKVPASVARWFKNQEQG